MTTTAICLKRRRSEFGPSLELPAAADVVYVGRAMYQGGWRLPCSPYANPFRAQRVGGAATAVELYAQWLPTQPDLMRRLPELRGKRLACWCETGPCHATHLADLVERLASGRGLPVARPSALPLQRGSRVLAFADLTLDPASGHYSRAGRTGVLTPTECDLLALLMRHPGRVLTPRVILRSIWRRDAQHGDASLKQYVSRLRRATEAGGEPRLVRNEWGIGYTLREAR